MDIILFFIFGLFCFLGGRVSAPAQLPQKSKTEDETDRDLEYLRNLNESLLTEVQQLRQFENNLRGQLWEAKQTLKTLQQKN